MDLWDTYQDRSFTVNDRTGTRIQNPDSYNLATSYHGTVVPVHLYRDSYGTIMDQFMVQLCAWYICEYMSVNFTGIPVRSRDEVVTKL